MKYIKCFLIGHRKPKGAFWYRIISGKFLTNSVLCGTCGRELQAGGREFENVLDLPKNN